MGGSASKKHVEGAVEEMGTSEATRGGARESLGVVTVELTVKGLQKLVKGLRGF